MTALPCIFLLNVLCAFRKDVEDFRPMERCFKCSHYLRFMREMAEEDEKVMDEIDYIHEHGYDAFDRWKAGVLES